jgi:hypothetical protein
MLPGRWKHTRFSLRTMLVATGIASVFLAIVVNWKQLSFVMFPLPDGRIVLKGTHIDDNTLGFDAFCSGNIVARFDYRNLLDSARIDKSDLVKPETNLAGLYRFSDENSLDLWPSPLLREEKGTWDITE